MAPVKTAYGSLNGQVSYLHQAYYRRRAEGGVGAIIIEPLYIEQAGKEHPKQLGISDLDHVKGLRNLVSSIHEGGALAVAHLNHAGRAANPKASKMTPEAPSPVTCPLTGIAPVELTKSRIEKIILSFAGAARRAVEAGFDLIEIQFGLGYLISQFLSPKTNLRQDEYGGSCENRQRFGFEVLNAIGSEISHDFPLIARISASDQVAGGLDIEDAVDLAKKLQKRGINAIHVASGSVCDSPPWYFQHMRLPLGKNLQWAAVIKQNVNIPVVVAGRMGDPEDIRRALEAEMVDAVALGRPLIADPDLPEKMRLNRDDEILQCGACLQGCLGKVKSGEGLDCIINPQVGHESEQFPNPADLKKIVVVGGGPAGIMAALTADSRGHNVVLFDSERLGGQFRLACMPPGKQMLNRPLQSLIHKIEQSSIKLVLSHKASIEDILSENPDLVILASGARPKEISIPGLENPLTAADVLMQKTDTGKNVLVLGGGMVGLEVAEYLAANNHQVTIVEILNDLAGDMLPLTKKLTLKALNRAGVEIITGKQISRFNGTRAFITNDDSEKYLGEFNSVVLAVGTSPQSELEPLLKEKEIAYEVVGDAKKPRQIDSAIKEGFEVTINI